VLETNDLTKYYDKTKGIENLSIDLKPGKIYGFIGPNGAGKSTTIRTLLNLIFPTSGKGTIFDKDIILDNVEIKKDIGYIPGEVNYYDDLSGIELLKYSASFYDDVDFTKITSLAESLKLDLLKKTNELSFGNRKKLAIIDALLHNPKLLILDEPTSGLDPLIQSVFYDILRKEKEKGTTILFSSHNLEEVKSLADYILFIKNGEIIREGNTNDLLRADYKKVVVYSREVKNLKLNKNINIRDKKDNMISFLFNGDVNDLFKLLSSIKIDDVKIEDLTIEELFMHYYEEEK